MRSTLQFVGGNFGPALSRAQSSVWLHNPPFASYSRMCKKEPVWIVSLFDHAQLVVVHAVKIPLPVRVERIGLRIAESAKPSSAPAIMYNL